MDTYIIYKHTSPSGGVYIGLTKHTLEHRSGTTGSQYLAKTKYGDYRLPLIARAILKYGWDNFTHEVLYENLTKQEADALEKDLIKLYKLGGKCYNIAPGGEGNSILGERNYFYNNPTYAFLGHHHTQENKDKLAKLHSKPILLYDLQGKFIKEWGSSLEVALTLNIDASCIRQATCGNIKTAYGFQWKLKDSNEIIKPVKDPHMGGVTLFSKDGILIKQWKSASEAARELGLNRAGICNCCNGKTKSSGGFVWKYN